ncbi:MAG: hypothetical protein OEZ58_00070 [Gammaproteobacteria bacterium]|nr:hypothetical protein [Gammaproteobacteria bacterium]
MQRQSTETIVTEQQLVTDFSVSTWLKKQIEETKKRDILDAYNDAQLLLQVIEQRYSQLDVLNRQ